MPNNEGKIFNFEKHRILASLESFVNILNNAFKKEDKRRHIDDNKVGIFLKSSQI